MVTSIRCSPIHKSKQTELLTLLSFALLCSSIVRGLFLFSLHHGRRVMLLREGELACSCFAAPIYPYLAVFSVPSVLIYNTREAPYVRHLVA